MTMIKNHNGYRHTFIENKLTLGLAFPLEVHTSMDIGEQVKLAKKAEDLGFSALFVRDSPLHDPKFGDSGNLFDPFVFLSYLAAHTEKIALGTASVVTPLRNPLHLAKLAASLDILSNNRFLFGVATGDRPIEYPAFKVESDDKGRLFRESIEVMKKVWSEDFPIIETEKVNLTVGDVLPKPNQSHIPLLGTGYAKQSMEWLAEHMDGFMFYMQEGFRQKELIRTWREHTVTFKPFIQPIILDLTEDPKKPPFPIPIKASLRTGRNFLIDYLYALQDMGINHTMFFLNTGSRPADEVIQEIGEYVVPLFNK